MFTQSKERFNGHHFVFKPADIMQMTPEALNPYAEQASQYIEKYGKGKMFQYAAEELLAFMQHGMAMFTTDLSGKLSGFIKVDPWVHYPNGFPENDGSHGSTQVLQYINEGFAHIVGLESGSLVVHEDYRKHHIGTYLKNEMAKYALEHFPHVSIFSVVTNTNPESIGLNNKVGWHPITVEQSQKMIGIDVLNVPGWDPSVPVTIFVYPPSLKESLLV